MKDLVQISLKSCIESLQDFYYSDVHGRSKNLPTRDGKMLPYTLSGEQVGAVESLLWAARQLKKRVVRQQKEIVRLKAEKCPDQDMIDRAIIDLDPDHT